MSLVVLVSIDGLRPDALSSQEHRFPAFAGMRAAGAWTLHATSVMPSITLPCHMSMFHSLPPERHGITRNTWQPMRDGVPGLIELAQALPEDAWVLVQSDHGGQHDYTHGTDAPQDMTIPWMVKGPGIRAGHRLSTVVSMLDTAPTLARLLGLEPHPAWEGHPIEEIFA